MAAVRRGACEPRGAAVAVLGGDGGGGSGGVWVAQERKEWGPGGT